MLRLWPESLRVGLFPGHCWLQGRRAAIGNSLWCASPAGSVDLLRAFETLLDGRTNELVKGSRIALTVSDSLAAIILLPWQESLRSPAERENYARILFDKQGINVTDNWVMRTAVRSFRATGIAYAFSREWLTELAEIVKARKLRLGFVLPITAAAYFGRQGNRRGARTLVLLQEENRTSALIFSRGKLLSRDVEPVTSSDHQSGERLLRRIVASYDDIARVVNWSTNPPEQTKIPEFISQCLPNAETRLLRRGAWN